MSPVTIAFYRISEVLVEVLELASVSDVGHVDVALQCDTVSPDRLSHSQQVGADATLNLNKPQSCLSCSRRPLVKSTAASIKTFDHHEFVLLIF